MKRKSLAKLLAGREALLLLVLALVAKAPLVGDEPTLFDAAAIESSPILRGVAPLREAFLDARAVPVPGDRPGPLAVISLAADLDAADGGMIVVRIGNLLLLLGLGYAFFRLLLRFGVARLPAAVAPLLISLHPAFVPALAGLSGRAPLLGLAGFVLAALFATREPTSRRDRVAAFAFALLGALAEPGCWPLALFPLAASFGYRRDLRDGLARSRPAIAAAVLVLLAELTLHGRLGPAAADRLVDDRGLGGALAASLGAIGSADLRLLFDPARATPDPAAPGAAALGGGFALVGFLFVAALLVLALRARRRGRGLGSLGLLLAALLLLPGKPILFSGVLPGPATILPVLALLVLPLADLLARPLLEPTRPTRFVLGLLIGGLTLFSLLRCWPYRDDELLRNSPAGRGPLGAIARAEDEAAREAGQAGARARQRAILEEALVRYPGEPRLLLERAKIELLPAGRPELASEALAALAADPRHRPGLAGLAGTLAAAAGDHGAARDHWQRGLADPDDALARFFLAQDAERAGDLVLAKRLQVAALDALRGPGDQKLALRVLNQLDYLRQRGLLERGNLRALASRQLGRAPRPEDRGAIEAFIARLGD